MNIDEVEITKAIVKEYIECFLDYTSVDVAVAGAGPSGMVAAKYLADKNVKVALFEKKLSIGGGLWGGGMMYSKIAVQKEALQILDDFKIKYKKSENINIYTADAVETAAKLASEAINSGAKFFNGISIEDVVIKDNAVSGLVLNWSAVNSAGLHVDPLTIRAKYCIDSTGHPVEVCKMVVKKVGKLKTPSGDIEGERYMDAEAAEIAVMGNTKEAYKNLYVSGMAANAVFGSPRMGPIFGGMLLSGKKVADLICERLKI